MPQAAPGSKEASWPITDKERRKFFERHGWKGRPATREEEIQDYRGDDDDIEYAIQMEVEHGVSQRHGG